MVRKAYVGFYWTLPVKWARFYRLPPGLDAAAAKSRTIRYQRERVRRYVAEARGELVDEVAFMDLRPDRGTGAVVEALKRVRERCTMGGATLLFVDFSEAFRWRPHRPLREYIEQQGLNHLPLTPDPVPLDGQPCFDPIKHFAAWRQRDGRRQERHEQALSELIAAVAASPKGPGHYEAVANLLNACGQGTATGRPWTAENVRKRLERHGLSRYGAGVSEAELGRAAGGPAPP